MIYLSIATDEVAVNKRSQQGGRILNQEANIWLHVHLYVKIIEYFNLNGYGLISEVLNLFF